MSRDNRVYIAPDERATRVVGNRQPDLHEQSDLDRRIDLAHIGAQYDMQIQNRNDINTDLGDIIMSDAKKANGVSSRSA